MLKKFSTVLIFTFLFLLFVPCAYASTLYLSPGSAQIPQGSVVSIRVGLNTGGESVNGVSAYLSYPADKLEVAWITYGGSFSIAAEGASGGGGIRISRGSISGVVGNVTVATIGFRGKTQGPAVVSFIGGSGAPRTSDSSDSLNLGASTGGTFTVVAGLPAGQTGTIVTPQAVKKDEKAPVIANIKTSLLSTNSATISWTTDENADSQVEYGLESGKYFLSSYSQVSTVNHLVKIEGQALTPGALFHFRVKSKDASGNEGTSYDQTFQLKGYTIIIEILDTDNKPVSNVNVLLYSQPNKSQTSSNGIVTFADITPGKHLVVVKVNNSLDKTGEIDVRDAPFTQNFTLSVNTKLSETGYFYLILAAVGLIVMAAITVTIIILIKKRQKASLTNNIPQQPV